VDVVAVVPYEFTGDAYLAFEFNNGALSLLGWC
jgi:hypothetical protein